MEVQVTENNVNIVVGGPVVETQPTIDDKIIELSERLSQLIAVPAPVEGEAANQPFVDLKSAVDGLRDIVQRHGFGQSR